MSSVLHSGPAVVTGVDRPRVRAWPVAALVGFPIGGWIANVVVGAVDAVGGEPKRRASRA